MQHDCSIKQSNQIVIKKHPTGPILTTETNKKKLYGP